jgi:hypothetical protein
MAKNILQNYPKNAKIKEETPPGKRTFGVFLGLRYNTFSTL